MGVRWCLLPLIVFSLIERDLCWDVLERMGSSNLRHVSYVFKNEYIFGDCNRNKTLYERAHVTFHDVMYTAIVRDWLWYTYRIPTCIILRAATYETDTYRVTKYNFEICVPRVTFCYNNQRHNYYYYEWYIPLDIAASSDWDIYFYGPNRADWTLK